MSVILFPFKLVWNLATFILSTVGRLVAIIIGVLLMIVGVVLTITIVAAPIGIPMFLFGLVMVARGFF
jgi:hypothetical protein